ncbi:RNA polymerase II-associated protein 3 [Paramormyrops kingsleyae]|uniref:RNA polymerase II-associated protein 3 n=1 Tax=Paramormyrops kingsleyae TaxID=1676925 RepID=A0A3B3TFT8_9TELE|nr:RNA polymerase II-associated protein 3 [Paramormyrops kingsleyae]XP_023671050.1 RNA polymerase II-associated protein 3 [Paramormyrops kingsleyae]
MSGGNKAIELQLQMRQNAEELHDFIRDLDSWENDIKKKDEELRSESSDHIQKQNLPPVRNKDYKKQKTNNNVASTITKNDQKKETRIKSYDYQSWEKFDADKELEMLDKDVSPVESESDSEETGIHIDREQALAEKEKGNQMFKEGKFDDAIDCYTRGMSADPYSPVLPTNRATCFLKLKKYAVAESDCNLAIALDRNYAKAYTRRGAARFALKKLESALEDYEMVLKLDPENHEAQNEVKKIITAMPSQADGSQASETTQEEVTESESQRRHAEEAQRRQEAVVQKDRGNAYFKEGKYEAAVQCYTQGMEADGSNALLPANRAMAYLRLDRYQEAEHDCSQAIALDSSYSKAFARRGTARAAMRKLREAKEDFEQVLKLEPGNKQAVNEITKITAEMAASGVEVDPTNQRRIVQPVSKPPHLRSTKPLKRMDIEEVGDPVPIIPVTVATCTAASGAARPVTDTGASEEGHLSAGSSPCAKIQKIEEISHSSTQASEKGLHEHRVSAQAPSKPTGKEPGDQQDLPPPEGVALPTLPTNSFQLEADLRKLRNYPELTYKYLKQIEPTSYLKIFQNSLEPEIFNQLLKILQAFYLPYEEPSLIFDILKNLSDVRRFDMAIMFMSSAERKVLEELFDRLHKAGLQDASVCTLKKKYGL